MAGRPDVPAVVVVPSEGCVRVKNNRFKLLERVEHDRHGHGFVRYYYRDSAIGWVYEVSFDRPMDATGSADFYVESALTEVSAVDQLADLAQETS